MKLQLYPPEYPSSPCPGLPAFHEPSPVSSRDTELASVHSTLLLLPALSHCSPRHAAKHTSSEQLLTSLSLPAVPSTVHSLAQRQERIACSFHQNCWATPRHARISRQRFIARHDRPRIRGTQAMSRTWANPADERYRQEQRCQCST